MNKYIILLFALTFTACKQQPQVEPVVTGTTTPAEVYTISGQKDIYLNNFPSSDEFTINIAGEGTGSNATVNYRLTHMPKYVFSEPGKLSGNLPLSHTFSFKSRLAKPGHYEARVVTQAGDDSEQVHKFNIHVVRSEKKDCHKFFRDVLDKDGKNPLGITYDPAKDELYITQMRVVDATSHGAVLYKANPSDTTRLLVYVDCNNGTLYTPETRIIAWGDKGQYIYDVSGSGKIHSTDSSTIYTLEYNCYENGGGKPEHLSISGELLLE